MITISAVDTTLLHAMLVGPHARTATPHQILQSTTLPTPGPTTRNDVQALAYTTMPLVTNSIGQSARPNPTVNQALRTSVTLLPMAGSYLSSINDSIEQAVAKRFAEMEAMIQKFGGSQHPSKRVSRTAMRTHLSWTPSLSSKCQRSSPSQI